jgi:hypothetical protein
MDNLIKLFVLLTLKSDKLECYPFACLFHSSLIFVSGVALEGFTLVSPCDLLDYTCRQTL